MLIHKHLLNLRAKSEKLTSVVPYHAQALGGSVLNSPENLPKPAHALCQVAMATW